MDINNEFYDELHDDWYTADDHPVALLRAENASRNPWLFREIEKHFCGPQKILDIGCGAGFLSNALAQAGHSVTGIDLSESSLKVAKGMDQTQQVQYICADAYALPFKRESFNVVCAMDILEHVPKPQQIITEASRVLLPGGLFFFHTFNRNWLSYLIAIKGVEWFVKNTPKKMHIYEYFITPSEIRQMCDQAALAVKEFKGYFPCLWSQPFWKMLTTRKVPKDFSFQSINSTVLGYSGLAIKPSFLLAENGRKCD